MKKRGCVPDLQSSGCSLRLLFAQKMLFAQSTKTVRAEPVEV